VIFFVLVVIGLCLGSFVNALIWRLHEQELENSKKKTNNKRLAELSIVKGHSMCPHCRHKLAAIDLIPLFSWLSVKGKCRYCGQSISLQYPLVELIAALLFVASYVWWPFYIHGSQLALFIVWLLILVGLLALAVYDLRWFLLPNRIIYPLGCLAIIYAVVNVISASRPLTALLDTIIAVIIGGGIFYALFQLSKGRWIGGGDVRLGWLLGLIAGTPDHSILFIFLASILGTIVSLPLLSAHRLKRNSVIPFGPFLIAGSIITQLFGTNIIHWYTTAFLNIH
jgi:leader peptidase (prepilin peptidase)/N-methyltransferase